MRVRSKATERGRSVFARSFNQTLALIVVLGLVVRIAFVTLVTFPPLPGDAQFFRLTASNLAGGKG